MPRVALKAMREVAQVRAELKGRAGLDPKYVIAIKAVYADEDAVHANVEWETVKRAAERLQGVELQRVSDLSRSIQAHLFPTKQEMDQASGAAPELKRGPSVRTLDASSEYKLLIVLELADRNLKHTIDHEHIAGKDWPAIRYVASHLGRALDHSRMPPSTIICGVPTNQQPAAAQPTNRDNTVTWFGVMRVRKISHTNA